MMNRNIFSFLFMMSGLNFLNGDIDVVIFGFLLVAVKCIMFFLLDVKKISPLLCVNCFSYNSKRMKLLGGKESGLEHLCYAVSLLFCYSSDLAYIYIYIYAILGCMFAAIFDRFWPLMDSLWRAAMQSILTAFWPLVIVLFFFVM
ncbi:unnamed protein product [Vicia faba]|uniref:Uncharacterized protein n=1 Tax=Vicia faba TaxID=3906 RepID=A0AAV0YYW8_VICFA|nr:unnamed protein product [Vicia faba]